MTDQVMPAGTHAAWRDVSLTQRVLAVVTAALLGIDAYVHLHDAAQYDQFHSSVMSEGTLFRIQGVVAIVVALALLIWPRVLTWIVSLLVAGSAAVAVTLYTYVNVGQLGPLPNLYENTWSAPGKAFSAIAETLAALVAIAGLTLAVRARSGRRGLHQV
jgi:glucan phosphoethanolaminetransferase (alkaline phosphatase superfamily)